LIPKRYPTRCWYTGKTHRASWAASTDNVSCLLSEFSHFIPILLVNRRKFCIGVIKIGATDAKIQAIPNASPDPRRNLRLLL
jgi:hypothetical protein